MIMILGLVLWFATHLFAICAPDQRKAMTDSMGVASKAVMAVLTLIAVALMVMGYQDAPYVGVWTPPAFLTHVNNLLMIVAVIFFIAGNVPSVIRQKVRHPQLAAAKTWALAHLLVNGDLASILLFGGILAWAVLALIGSNKRDGKGPIDKPATAMGLVIHIVVALVVFGIIAMVHNWAGVSPFPG
jgi:uncharacterized membrane protein